MFYLRNVFSLLVYTILTCACIDRVACQENGQALSLQGNSYFNVPFIPDSVAECTIELWVNPSQADLKSYLIYFGDDDSSGFGLTSEVVPGAPGLYSSVAFNGVSESITGNYARLPLNIWTHLAVTRSNQKWEFYHNGMLVGRASRLPFVHSEKMVIGKNFHGEIDEVRIWNKALSGSDILSSIGQTLRGDEPGLIADFSMDLSERQGDSVLLNSVQGISSLGAAHLNAGGSPPIYPKSTLQFLSTKTPTHIFGRLPAHQQFFARDRNGFAHISIAGMVTEVGSDSVIITEQKNDVPIKRISFPLQFSGGDALFEYSDSIHAELSEYTFDIYVLRHDTMNFIGEAADLVAGDAFFITGQSNAHPAIAWYANTNPFYRTFGIQTTNLNFDPYDPADTSWGYGNAHGWGGFFSGPYLVGVWGQRLEDHINDSYGIPTCIINGAAGGSTIEQHLPSNTDRADLASIYGRALYRSAKSGLQNKYKALFWYQGEYNSASGYFDNFSTLYHSWIQDFGTSDSEDVLKKIYVFQIHPGCVPGQRSELRELQRTISDYFPRLEVMSTCGIDGHDGCHYDAFGYWHIADNIFRLVARDFYSSNDTLEILPPNIANITYGDSSNNTIVLRFNNSRQLSITPDTLVEGKLMQLKDYFYLDGVSGAVSNVEAVGDSVILKLTSISNAKLLTYLPDETYNNNDTLIYEGPWILNPRGIGAFSFYELPIQAYIPDTSRSGSASLSDEEVSLQCFPNPVEKTLVIKYRVRSERPVVFDILNILGTVVMHGEKILSHPGENFKLIDLSPLPAGEYTLRATNGTTVITQKIVYVR